MRFFKVVNRSHPSSKLPTVMWDPTRDAPLFAFQKGPSGFLELETDDKGLIKRLTDMGYPTDEALARTKNIQGPSTMSPPAPEPVRLEKAGVEVPAELMTSGGAPAPKPLKKGA